MRRKWERRRWRRSWFLEGSVVGVVDSSGERRRRTSVREGLRKSGWWRRVVVVGVKLRRECWRRWVELRLLEGGLGGELGEESESRRVECKR